MFGKLFKKKEQAKAPDVTLAFEIPDEVKQRLNGWAGNESKKIFADYLKTVSRVQLLAIGDNPWYKDHEHYEWLIEAYDCEEYKRDWPLSKWWQTEGIPSTVWDTIPIDGLDKKNPINLAEVVKKVEGIQKKLDRVLKIIENTEVTMSAKTALKM